MVRKNTCIPELRSGFASPEEPAPQRRRGPVGVQLGSLPPRRGSRVDPRADPGEDTGAGGALGAKFRRTLSEEGFCI